MTWQSTASDTPRGMMTSGLLYLGLFPAAPHFEPNLSEQEHIPVMGRSFPADIKRGLHEDESDEDEHEGNQFLYPGKRDTEQRMCLRRDTEVRSGGAEKGEAVVRSSAPMSQVVAQHLPNGYNFD